MFRSVLQITDNNEHALIENADGRLTERQYQRLLAEIWDAQPTLVSLVPTRLVATVSEGVMLAALALVPLGVFLFAFDLLNEEGVLPAWFVLLIVLVVLGIPLLMWWLLNARQQFSKWRTAHQQVANHHYRIEGFQGQIRCAIYPNPRGQVYGDKYVVSTPDHEFEVSQALYDYIRPYSEDVTLYYLSEPFTTLLSIEPTPVQEAPTDDELARVVGVGDDGELIYEDDDERLNAS
jgi:hypothetical protein